ncbi:MAG: MFS transporter [Burkholderiales bacterium]|nr:MFS transporter [Burkholderiales bacterium]
MPTHVNRLLAARGLRAFGDGFVSLLLPLYLLELGYESVTVGLVASATLLGSGVMTLGVGLVAHRFPYRALLLAAAGLMAATGAGFATVTQLWPLLVIAFVGTLNPSNGDVSVFVPLEHAVLSRVVEDRRRTAVFARYALVGSLVAAVGALAAGVPALLARWHGLSLLAAMQAMFILYGLLGAGVALAYRGLPPMPAATPARATGPLTRSRRAVFKLAALFALDSFGGGFIVQSLLALWLFQRFELTLGAAGSLFFVTGIVSAISYLVAARVAQRFGLVNTMVFTHLPANVCLVAIALVPDLAWAVALLVVRAFLSQMDVPTRSSYVMAIVPPEERAAAASVTLVPRSLAAAASPFLAGWLLALSPFGWPLVAAGTIKIVYDVLLLATFRHVRPPEES